MYDDIFTSYKKKKTRVDVLRILSNNQRHCQVIIINDHRRS